MIKAIETSYKGHRFRSRLEARWAVYLDQMGIRWEYEKEGYDLGGVRYLPDFWLPDFSLWAEVKPEPFALDESKKALQLFIATSNDVVMLVGVPEGKVYQSIRGNGFGLFRYKEWLWDAEKLQLDYASLPYSAWPDDYKKKLDDFVFLMPEVQRAVIAARSMRFEYGGLR